MQHLQFRQQHIRTMVNSAYECAPREACGLISGSAQQVLDVLPAKNVASSKCRYEIHPEQLAEMFSAMETQGRDLLGIWHSHPGARPRPSATDSRLAFYPQAVYVIVSILPADEDGSLDSHLVGLGLRYAGEPGPAVLRGYLCTEAGGGWQEVALLQCRS